MLRKLLIVFASGLVIAVIALSIAWLSGGRELRDQIARGDIDWNVSDGDHDHHGGPSTTRSFPLASGAKLVMALPVELEFRRGNEAGMTVEGPKEAIERLIWQDGRLSLGGRENHLHRSIKVTIVAPEIGDLDFEAPADVNLHGLDQQQLRLTGRGAVDIDAQGRVSRIFVDSEGAGSVDLSRVTGDDATVRIAGVGNVEVAATRMVDVEINGAGSVSLKNKPVTIRTQINGVGTVDKAYED